MAALLPYRVWLKDGTFEIAVAKNPDEAVGIVIGKGTPRSKLKSTGRVTPGRGPLKRRKR